MDLCSRRLFLFATTAALAASVPGLNAQEPEWQPLFDGKTFGGWQVTDFAGHGEVRIEEGALVMEAGNDLTGVHFPGVSVQMQYELELEARRLEGSDFFCGLTFPVGGVHCTLVVGGWGGTVVGISSVDGEDASENATSQTRKFELGRWYRIRVRVSAERIEAWIDEERVVGLDLTGRTIGMRLGEIEMSKPLGVASFRTRAALRGLRMRRLG
jgi:hypothetical protein